jgi:hypothetical protein
MVFNLAMKFSRSLLVALLLFSACGTSRGPVDRSVDAAHATNTTVGETAEDTVESPRSAFVAAVTFPFRLVARVGEALFGP